VCYHCVQKSVDYIWLTPGREGNTLSKHIKGAQRRRYKIHEWQICCRYNNDCDVDGGKIPYQAEGIIDGAVAVTSKRERVLVIVGK
jgi:hypothetical protein